MYEYVVHFFNVVSPIFNCINIASYVQSTVSC